MEAEFLKSLGFPDLSIHSAFNHFDFQRPCRRILVIGPMGSGKTEFSARVWRDSLVALRKSDTVLTQTANGQADRRKVFFIRSILDRERFPDYPQDALPFRGGYERCGASIADIADSFELEKVLADNPQYGTWVLDEAAFYEERLVYIVERESKQRDLIFIFPTLVLNFRREIFNPTIRLLLDVCTDVFPLTAYCEHAHCLTDAFNTYRYYQMGDKECPALYFDPLIIIGGDQEKNDPREPNYCTRCDSHHYLPGKEYTYLVLKPLGEKAAAGDTQALIGELKNLKQSMDKSLLFRHFEGKYLQTEDPQSIMMNALEVQCIAEKALLFLFAEQNLISRQQMLELMDTLALDQSYIRKRLQDNGRIL